MNAPKVRIIPVLKTGKGHEGHVDGYIVHHDDRRVRALDVAAAKKRKASK